MKNTNKEELDAVVKKHTLLGLISVPFAICFGLGSYATFNSAEIIPISFLADPVVARFMLGIGVIGMLAGYTGKFVLEKKIRNLSKNL